MKPVFFRRSYRTPSRLPQLVSQRRDIVVSEWLDAVSGRGRLTMAMGVLRVFARLPRMFRSRQMVLLPVLLLRDAMRVRRAVM